MEVIQKSCKRFMLISLLRLGPQCRSRTCSRWFEGLGPPGGTAERGALCTVDDGL